MPLSIHACAHSFDLDSMQAAVSHTRDGLLPIVGAKNMQHAACTKKGGKGERDDLALEMRNHGVFPSQAL